LKREIDDMSDIADASVFRVKIDLRALLFSIISINFKITLNSSANRRAICSRHVSFDVALSPAW
jgi:hypothetical protein